MSEAATVAAPASSSSSDSGPYKFLDFYSDSTSDQQKFAGRDRDVREVVARISTNRTFVLYGRSGLGKTSLLLAGVFPELRRRNLTPIYVRTIDAPLNDLWSAVAAGLNIEAIDSADELLVALRKRSAAGTTVLVFDQFEEFFIHLRQQPQLRREFVRTIADLAANPDLHLRIVFSLREDYLAELDEFRDDVDDLFANDYRLKPLTAFGARQAAAQPLIQARVPYERRLLARIVDLLADVGFDPLMLQILCTEIYRQAVARNPNEPRLTEADLDEAGGLEGVVRRYLDRVVRTIPKGSVLLSRTIIDALITQEQTKRAVTFETLATADFSASREEIDRVLQIFVQQKLVRTEQRGGQEWYELTHERLVKAALDWLDLDRDYFNFRTARNLVTNSCRGEIWRDKVETLLTEGHLRDVIGPYAQRFRFPTLEQQFVFSSAVYRRTPLEYWASLVGDATAAQIVLAFLQSPTDAVRESGARAAGNLPRLKSALAETCLEVAMHDKTEAVRRAAGRALAVIGDDSQIARLAELVDDRVTRRQALQVVADLRLSNRSVKSFQPMARLRARWIANGRVKKAHTEAMRERGVRGALAGLITAVIWVPAVALPLLLAASWIAAPMSWVEFGAVAAYIFVFGIAIATFLGWRVGRIGALNAAHRGEGAWFHAVMSLRFPLWLAGALTVIFAFPTYFDHTLWPLIVFPFIVAIVPMLFVGVMARMTRPAVWPSSSPRSVWIWAIAASAGFPILFVGLFFSGSVISGYINGAEGLEILYFFVALLASLLSAVVLVVLARTARPPVDSPPTTSALADRIRVCALVAAAMIWFVAMFGRQSIPFFAPTLRVEAGKPLTLQASFRDTVSDSAFFIVDVPDNDLEWRLVSDAQGEIVGLNVGDREDGRLPSNVQALSLGPGRHRIRLRPVWIPPIGPDRAFGEKTARITLTPIPFAGLETPVRSDEVTFVVVEFKRSVGTNAWTARIGGSIPTTAINGSAAIYVYSAPPLSADSTGYWISTSRGSSVYFTERPYVTDDAWRFYEPLIVPIDNGKWDLDLKFNQPMERRDATITVPLVLKLAPAP